MRQVKIGIIQIEDYWYFRIEVRSVLGVANTLHHQNIRLRQPQQAAALPEGECRGQNQSAPAAAPQSGRHIVDAQQRRPLPSVGRQKDSQRSLPRSNHRFRADKRPPSELSDRAQT